MRKFTFFFFLSLIALVVDAVILDELKRLIKKIIPATAEALVAPNANHLNKVKMEKAPLATPVFPSVGGGAGIVAMRSIQKHF